MPWGEPQPGHDTTLHGAALCKGHSSVPFRSCIAVTMPFIGMVASVVVVVQVLIVQLFGEVALLLLFQAGVVIIIVVILISLLSLLLSHPLPRNVIIFLSYHVLARVTMLSSSLPFRRGAATPACGCMLLRTRPLQRQVGQRGNSWQE